MEKACIGTILSKYRWNSVFFAYSPSLSLEIGCLQNYSISIVEQLLYANEVQMAVKSTKLLEKQLEQRRNCMIVRTYRALG